jgi:lysophospholipase L1-like esterase
MPRKLIRTTKLLLDTLIAGCIILIPVILMTGGFKLNLFGISIGATHLYTPLTPLLLLVVVRLFLSLDRPNFLLLVFSIGIGLGAAELAVHVWHPPISKPHMRQMHRPAYYTDWELVPGASGIGALGEAYFINDDGYRGKQRSMQKQPEVTRVIIIGDSFTYGMGVDLEDTYPQQLETFLNRNGGHYEVLNFGVIGYNMWQYNELLPRTALSYQPDIIILTLYQNDLKQSRPPYETDPDYRPHNPFAQPAATKQQGLLSRSALWNLLKNLNARIEYKYRYLRGHDYLKNIPQRKQQFGTAQSGSKDYKILTGTFDGEKTLAFSKALRRFVATAREGGAKVLIAYIPDAIQLNNPKLQVVNQQIANWSRAIGVPFVDLSPALEQDPKIESLYLFPFDAHNSPKGLHLIAQTLADALKELGYVGKGNRPVALGQNQR